MKKLLSSILVVLFFACLAHAQEDKKLFTMIYSKGETWNDNLSTYDQEYFKSHSMHLQNLRKEKKIIIGGRYSDYGFMILEASNMKEAELITQQDSSVIAGTFKVELFEFIPFYYGCIEENEEK